MFFCLPRPPEIIFWIMLCIMFLMFIGPASFVHLPRPPELPVYASQQGRLEAIRFPCDAGAEKNQPISDGRTLLYATAQLVHLEVNRDFYFEANFYYSYRVQLF